MTVSAILWRWDGEERALRPLTNRPLDLEHGHTYRLDPVEDRSWKSHRHYFATVNDLWQNLPERLQMMPWAGSPDMMRDNALIETKWYTTEVYDCATNAEALRWRAQLPALVRAEAKRARPVYTVTVVRGSTLVRYVPRSQAYRAMTSDEFQQSKDDTLAFLSDLIGVGSDLPAYVDDAARLRAGG